MHSCQIVYLVLALMSQATDLVKQPINHSIKRMAGVMSIGEMVHVSAASAPVETIQFSSARSPDAPWHGEAAK